MFIHQVIYSSQPFGYDEAMLMGILMDARRRNAAENVTGALICRADVYLQLLEGPAATVMATMERIRRDDRHLDIRMHQAETVEQRMFGKWAMLHDPAQSWMWTQAEVAQGALERAAAADVRAVFERLAEQSADTTS